MLALDPRVVDAVWAAVQAHLPPRPPETHPLGCHRPRIPDRDCFTGILLRLVTGWSPAAPGKRSISTDLFGIPIGAVIDGANRNDSILLAPTLQAVADRGLLADVETLHLDRGHDSLLTTQRCQALGLTDVICVKKRRKGEPKTKKPLALGLRWPVERTNSWLSNFGQLRRNTDRFSPQRLGQIALAIALILT